MSCSNKPIYGIALLGILGVCVTTRAQAPANFSATDAGPGSASFSPNLSASAGFSAAGGAGGGGGGGLRRNNNRQTGMFSPSLSSAGSLSSRQSAALRGSTLAAAGAYTPYRAKSSVLPSPPMAIHVAPPSSYSGIRLGLSAGSGGAPSPSWSKSSQGSEPAYAFVLKHEGAKGMGASSHGPKSDRKKKSKGDVLEQLLGHRSY